MLCLADCGFSARQKASATGADLPWRVKDNLKLEVVTDLPDGSWVAEVFDPVAARRRQRPSRVRVIEYTVEDGREWGSPGRR